jgi:hypothetical protein
MRFHTVAMGHTDEAALNTLAQLLSGKTGRLYKRLVAKEDATIGEPQARNMSRKYAGFFEINATVKEGRTPEEVESLILEEIDGLREGEIGERELQKVKNQVLASSIRRLRSNTGLMFQLGLYETWYDWSYINDSPKLMLAVTADDVRRVVKDYFDPKTRTLAIYRTKEGASVAPQDPELEAALAGLSPEQKEQTMAMIKRIKESDDIDTLNRMHAMMGRGASSDRVPDDQKAVFRHMLNILEARIAELEASDKESD